jgi:hypothetical protein
MLLQKDTNILTFEKLLIRSYLHAGESLCSGSNYRPVCDSPSRVGSSTAKLWISACLRFFCGRFAIESTSFGVGIAAVQVAFVCSAAVVGRSKVLAALCIVTT